MMDYKQHLKNATLIEGDSGFLNRNTLSRNSSAGCSSRIYYYRRSSEGIPFNWEMQPGTPKVPPKEDIIPPLSPPPAVISLGLPKPCLDHIEEPKPSMLLRFKYFIWKQNHKKNYQGSKKISKGSRSNNNNNNNVNVDVDVRSSDKFMNFKICSSDGEFMSSPACNSGSSSSSSFSFRSSRVQSRNRDSSTHETYGCSPWGFSSVLVRVARRD